MDLAHIPLRKCHPGECHISQRLIGLIQLCLRKKLGILAELRVAFPCFIPMHIGYTACTIWEQFGYRYAETARKESSELYGDNGIS